MKNSDLGRIISSKGNYTKWDGHRIGIKNDSLISYAELNAGPGFFHNIEDAWFEENKDDIRQVVPNDTEINDDGTMWKKSLVKSEVINKRELLSSAWDQGGAGIWRAGKTTLYSYTNTLADFKSYEKAVLESNTSSVSNESFSFDRFIKLAGLLKS